MNKLITILVLSATIYSVAGFGKQLIRSAGKQQPLPVTVSDAAAAGYVKSNRPCDPMIGQAYNKDSPAPTSQYPLTLYFAANGMISGFGTDVFGNAPANLIEHGYWLPVGKNQYRIQAATRNATQNLCTVTAPFSDTIGDRIIINPSKLNQRIPANEQEAQKSKWTRGACISGMGRHWEYDLATAPVQSFNSSNLMPVVAMYDLSGNLNAVFFASTDVQQGITGNHQWDIIPIPGALMCKNFCGCNWPTFSMWSTMHIWFGTTDITCPSAC